MDRRAFLGATAAALAGPLLSGGLVGCGDDDPPDAPRPFLPPVGPIAVDDAELDATIQWLVDTPQADLLARAGAELSSGLPIETLDLAIVHAGLRRVACFRAGDAHRIFAHQALQGVKAHMAPVHALEWSLWSAHRVQDPVDTHRWGISTYRPPTASPPAAQAADRYVAAVRGGDPAGAEAAAMALYLDGGWSSMLDLLYRTAVTDLAELDHAVIGLALFEPYVAASGENRAEAVVRYIARSQAYVFDGPPAAERGDPYASWWATNIVAARAMSGSLGGSPDPDASLAVLAATRTKNPSDAIAVVRDLWTQGVAATSLWDGLVLSAAEQMLVDKSGSTNARGGEVHALTHVNAMRNAFDSAATSAETRALMLLQATAFATLFTLGGPPPPALDSIAAHPSAGGTLDAWRAHLGPAEADIHPSSPLPHPIEGRQRDVARAVRAAVSDGLDAVALIDAHLAAIRRSAKATHAVKFPIALRQELTRVAPDYRAWLAPTLAFYMDGAEATNWSAYDDARAVAAEVMG